MSRVELHVLHAARKLRWSRALARLAPLLLMACYTYRPLSGPMPAAGDRVQIALTDAGSDALTSRIGPNIALVEGNVVKADSTSLTLAVREIENRRGQRDDWLGETVVVPNQYVRDIQQRRLSVGGTGLLGGAIAAGLVAATAAMGSGSAQGGGSTASAGKQ